MFGTTCVFMKLMECTGVGEGLNLSGHAGGTRVRRGRKGITGDKFKALSKEWPRGVYLKGIMRERSTLEKSGGAGEMCCEGIKT